MGEIKFRKKWFEIWVWSDTDLEMIKVARVLSPGLANIFVEALKNIYKKIEVR